MNTIFLTGLPIGPSVNHLFANVSGKGRVKSNHYRAWRNACGWEVRAQKPMRLKGPVSLTYTIEEGGTRTDLGNLEKAVTDLLVELQLIDGDGPEVVREIHMRWGDVRGLQIRVEPAPAAPLLERVAA